jgi:starch phosphorylase
MGTIAYFSMEVGLDPGMPTYAGGLGMLAGDTLRSAADLGLGMVGVTLLTRKGYFRQRLDAAGRQAEEPAAWDVPSFLAEQPERAEMRIEGRTVRLRSWRYDVRGLEGIVPVYLLDTDLPENAPADRALTDVLYGGDDRYRLCQEAVLGIGGVRMLRALGYARIDRFHLNEGHASLLVFELLDETTRARGGREISPDDIAAVRHQCVFTTHTPVAAGHDQFAPELVEATLGPGRLAGLRDRCCHAGRVNLTYVALNFSHYVNGVALKHMEVSQKLFSGYAIDAITNGVHAATWTAPEFQALFDRHIPGWRRDNFSLRYALSLPPDEIRAAHAGAKARLIDRVSHDSGVRFDPAVLTLGFARRATAYKRADLIVHDLSRLRAIAAAAGGLQIVFAGKAHPRDWEGKAMIERIFDAKTALGPSVPMAYLEEYDMTLGRLLTAGADVWLNTPHQPFEASGTSGMKAALNGVPSLSVPDGWWVEGCVENVTGWSIGVEDEEADDRTELEARALYDRLEQVVAPLFYRNRAGFLDVMRHAIALNGSFFNSHRMLEEYQLKAYAT